MGTSFSPMAEFASENEYRRADPPLTKTYVSDAA
jgi:hypothetical protein